MAVSVFTAIGLKDFQATLDFIARKNRKAIWEVIKAEGFLGGEERIFLTENGEIVALTATDWINESAARVFAHGGKHLELMRQYSKAVHLYIGEEEDKPKSFEEVAKMLDEERYKKQLSPIRLWKAFPGAGIKLVPKDKQLMFCLSKDFEWLWYKLGLTSQQI